jgi:tetratricopeptide (TPR) repeat protein
MGGVQSGLSFIDSAVYRGQSRRCSARCRNLFGVWGKTSRRSDDRYGDRLPENSAPTEGEIFSNKTEVNLDEASEAKFLETTTAVPQYLTLKAQLEFLQEKPDRALAYAVQAKEPIALIGGSLLVAVHNFYYSLSLAASYQQASSAEKEEYWQQLMANQEQMQVWMDNCPENFTHQYLLVAAEMARLSGDQLEAIELYDRAIAAAKEHNFIHNEGLANELAAKFYLHWGKEKMAIGFMLTDAYYCYALLGSRSKNHPTGSKISSVVEFDRTIISI